MIQGLNQATNQSVNSASHNILSGRLPDIRYRWTLRAESEKDGLNQQIDCFKGTGRLVYWREKRHLVDCFGMKKQHFQTYSSLTEDQE